MSLISKTIADDLELVVDGMKPNGVMGCKIPVKDYPSVKICEALDALYNSNFALVK